MIRHEMRKCEDCKIILDQDAHFCPNCGRALDEAGNAEAHEARQRLGVLMTSANLHRARQEWDEAIADATEALRLDPASPEAASLLASIYEQRGDSEEALVWSRIALDMDPQSITDRARIDRINRSLSGDLKRSPRGSGLDWRTWAIAAGAGLIVILLAVVMVLALGSRKQNTVATGPKQPSERSSRAVPIRAPGSERSSSGERLSASETTLSGSRGPATTQARTPAEVAIREAVARSDALRSARGSVDDVIADPRQGVAIITVSLPASASLGKDTVIMAAAGAARAAFAANNEVKFVTARCLAGPPGRAQIAFVGDTARETMQGLAENAAPEQIQAAFANTWWNPQLGR